jgi:S1-C subfamily serine protease
MRLSPCALLLSVALAPAIATAQEPLQFPTSPSSVTSGASSASGTITLPDLASKSAPAVALLTVYDAQGQKLGSGTGFFVSAGGRMVTNHHVVEKASRISAKLTDGRELRVLGVLTQDEARDLAVVQVEGSGYPWLPLGDSRTLRVGDEIAVIGSPLGLSTALSTGVVAAVREDGLPEEEKGKSKLGAWAIQITAATSPGSSGSPVLSRRGEVVAVVVGGYSNAEGMSFGIRAEAAQALIERIPPGAAPSPFATQASSTAEILRNLMISAGVFGAASIAWLLWSRLRTPRARRGSIRPAGPKGVG